MKNIIKDNILNNISAIQAECNKVLEELNKENIDPYVFSEHAHKLQDAVARLVTQADRVYGANLEILYK